MNIALIPARGGSKRIPRKNIRQFAGKPMIAWPIEVAIASTLFDRVIVSTDDLEIKQIAEECGAEVPFLRPAELADDHTITNDVIKHAIQWLLQHGVNVINVCCIYATSPFLEAKYLRDAYQKMVSGGKDYSFSIAKFPSSIQRALRINSENCIESIWPENTETRSQDLEQAYFDAGQFYWGRVEAFLRDQPIHSPAAVPVILPREMAQDIDTPEDWSHAELIFKALRSELN